VIGLVSLVGAGPGALDLLTLRAARRLGEADLVLHDALVPPDARTLAPRARWFFVGKRAGRPGIGQDAIHRLMIRAARRGERVVRLKGGDPFVFGHGGEEALALVSAGIPFEVVPGISSAVAAAGLAGIPVTHRGLASAFVVVSGHAPVAYEPVLDSLAPRSATVVVMMGLGRRAQIAATLLARGWAPRTPAAIVWSAATPHAETWTGTLSALGTTARPEGLEDAPGVLVIGDAVSLAGVLGPSVAEQPSSVAVGQVH
jgi:uroporphyrin-III C-methyltransferase/precorrin-2 dehydrogenase/sirohydrochlorin ferrochelatase